MLVGGQKRFLAGVLDWCWTPSNCVLLRLRGCWGNGGFGAKLTRGQKFSEWGVVALPPKKGGVLDRWKKHSFCGGAGRVLVAAVKLLYMVFWACAGCWSKLPWWVCRQTFKCSRCYLRPGWWWWYFSRFQ